MVKRAAKVLVAVLVLCFCVAIVVLGTSPFVAMCLLDSGAPDWVLNLCSLVFMVCLTGVVFTAVSALLFPFVFFGLKLLGSSIRAKILDYALACMFGCSIAIALCATTAQFEANRHPTGYYSATFQRVKDSAEESARNSSYGNVVWGQLRELQNAGALLVCAEYFVDHAANFLMPGILLPPMFLYIWKRRKNN